MNVIDMRRPQADLATRLRELVVLAETGEMTELVVGYSTADIYNFVYGLSPANCVVLSSMLHQGCVDRMRK